MKLNKAELFTIVSYIGIALVILTQLFYIAKADGNGVQLVEVVRLGLFMSGVILIVRKPK